ncbi:MAG: hypothetical protein J6M02_04595 [Clostridia bacterium]|nr:hypothetical protein [Clostridia bacterium]
MKEKDREQVKKEKKVDNLINIVENHTRTERHLEQYSEIGDLEFKEMARDKQKVREEQIHELKDQLVGVDKEVQTKEDQLKGIKTRYEFAEGYMENNKDRMNQEDLKNLKKKQENRKDQIESLEEDR